MTKQEEIQKAIESAPATCSHERPIAVWFDENKALVIEALMNYKKLIKEKEDEATRSKS